MFLCHLFDGPMHFRCFYIFVMFFFFEMIIHSAIFFMVDVTNKLVLERRNTV